jgi:DNA anti-recombination protein RmuC
VGHSLTAFATTFEQRAGALLASVNEAYATLQTEHAVSDQQRLAAWRGSLDALAASLHQEWQQAGAQTLKQQQQICDSLTQTAQGITGSLDTLAVSLHREWQQTGAQTLAQQEQICTTLAQTAQDITEQAKTSASTTLGEVTRLLTCSEELIRSRITSEADWITQHSARMDQLASLLRTELGALRDDEAQRGDAAVARLGELQTALTQHLTTLGTALEDPITRLIETASEAPRAAADVIGQLRQEMSSSLVRDNALLEERSRIMATLNALLDGINHASAEQRTVIDALVATSSVALNQAGSQFAEQVSTETGKLAEIAAHVTSSAVEVSSLSDAFGFAVNSFSEANEKLIDNLQRIEAAMDKSMLRSDEQLAYYVAQAREIIDLSIMSQKEIFEELRQLPGKQVRSAEEVN